MSDTVNRRLLDVLISLADELVERLDADACALSRVIGDVLIMVAEKVPEGRTFLFGQGYLVPDFPLTGRVLATGEPLALTLDDPDVDEAEASVLRDQGYAALLMAPLLLGGEVWGLVEVYRVDSRPFAADAMRNAVELSRIA